MSFHHYYVIFFRFSRLAFWARGSAPLLIVSHSLNIKFNQPSKTQNINIICFNHPGKATLVETLEAVSLLFLHFNDSWCLFIPPLLTSQPHKLHIIVSVRRWLILSLFVPWYCFTRSNIFAYCLDNIVYPFPCTCLCCPVCIVSFALLYTPYDVLCSL